MVALPSTRLKTQEAELTQVEIVGADLTTCEERRISGRALEGRRGWGGGVSESSTETNEASCSSCQERSSTEVRAVALTRSGTSEVLEIKGWDGQEGPCGLQ